MKQINTYIYIYIDIYYKEQRLLIWICVLQYVDTRMSFCVCTYFEQCMYIYIYICVCVCAHFCGVQLTNSMISGASENEEFTS